MDDEARRRRVLELLAPDGELLGEIPRSKRPVRRVVGSREEAKALFEELAQLGHESPVQNPGDRSRPGRRVEIPGFGFVSYRDAEDEETGETTPTIQCSGNLEGLENVKFKFVMRLVRGKDI